MSRQLIEAIARAEAIRDHPTTPMVCRSVITELVELLREMEIAIDLAHERDDEGIGELRDD